MIKIKKILVQVNFLILMIMMSGCLNTISEFEHENDITINFEDNNYRISFSQYLDSETIPFFNPEDNWKRSLDSNKIYLTYSNSFNYNNGPISLFRMNTMPDSSMIEKQIFSPIFNEELIMDSPLEINHFNLWVFDGFKIKNSRTYRLMASFKNRNLVPGLKSILNSDEQDINFEDIINQIIETLYLETLNHSQIKTTDISKILNDIKINNNLNISEYLDDDPFFTSLETILNNAEKHLIKSISKNNSDHIKEIDSIWEQNKLDIYISLLLVFNEFKITANMPGEIIFHNADSTYSNSLDWEFDITNFSDSPYTVFAESRKIQNNGSESAVWAGLSLSKNKNLMNIYVIFFLAITLFLTLSILAKRKQKK